jgi:hypothetical protein
MKVYVVSPEDMDRTKAGWYGDTVKCGGCNWAVSRLYVLATSKKEAVRLFKRGEAGLCGDCFCDMLAEGGYEIVPTRRKGAEP